jgi:signal transduction histidine kinase
VLHPIDKTKIVPTYFYVLLAINIFLIFKEYSFVQASGTLASYLVFKLIFISTLLLTLFLIKKRVSLFLDNFEVVCFVAGIAHCCLWSLYSADMWIGAIQFISIFPYLFDIRDKKLAMMLAFGTLFFNIFFYSSGVQFNSVEKYSNKTAEVFIVTSMTAFIAYFCSKSLRTERNRAVVLSSKFVELGRKMSFIVHDIKNALTGPTIYVSKLMSEVTTAKLSQGESTLLNFLKNDIGSINEFVVEITKLAGERGEASSGATSVADVVKTITIVFRSSLHGANITVINDGLLSSHKTEVTRILTNAVINSCDAIKRAGVAEGKVCVSCQGSSITISDNSGLTLNETLMDALNDYSGSATSKQSSGGLGTQAIKAYMHELGGSVSYSNGECGVVLSLTLPVEVLRPFDLPGGAV